MKRVTVWLVAGCLVGSMAVAQEPPAGRDSNRLEAVRREAERRGGDSARVEALRREVERRFSERVRTDLALSDRQMDQLREHQGAFMRQRSELMMRQRALRLALEQQMRPGVAADADSVRRLNDALRENRGRIFALEQEEDAKLSEFLSPVQVAQYRQLRERLAQRVNELRRRAGPGPAGAGQAQPPRQRPRQRPR
jgi:chromosome segregation ATPase